MWLQMVCVRGCRFKFDSHFTTKPLWSAFRSSCHCGIVLCRWSFPKPDTWSFSAKVLKPHKLFQLFVSHPGIVVLRAVSGTTFSQNAGSKPYSIYYVWGLLFCILLPVVCPLCRGIKSAQSQNEQCFHQPPPPPPNSVSQRLFRP